MTTSVPVGVAFVLVAYFVGAIPVGLLVVRWQRGIDLRRFGSGSTGTTNVYRAAGWKAAAIVFVADILKVMVPVVVARDLTGSEWIAGAAGVAGLAGHCWPVYSGWSGGRGATGALGGILVLQPLIGLLCLLTCAVVVALTRYVSLGSLLGAAVGTVAMVYLLWSGAVPMGDIVLTIGAPLIIFIRHRDNIIRLLGGTERKFGASGPDVAPKMMS
jgi:glycerol-3-phosphate acyltransferase PlsY